MADNTLKIKTELENSAFKKGLQKLGGVTKAMLTGVAGAVGATATAIKGLALASVKARGELEQNMGGAEAVFGEFAEKAKADSQKAFATMGLSANDYLQTINKMGSLMQGSGISQEKALKMSTEAMQRASDVASIMGIDVTSAMEAVNGMAKGNFTMMDNLGVSMNATTLEAYALSKGIKKTYNEMSNAEKVELAQQMFMEKTAQYAGNYAKENETLAGSITTLKASWDNFMSGAGNLGDVISSARGAFNAFAKTLGESMDSIIDNIVDWLPELMDLGFEILNKLLEGVLNNQDKLITSAITLVQDLIGGITDAFPMIVTIGAEMLVSLVKGLSESLPEMIPTIVECILLMVDTLLDNIDLLIDCALQLIIALAEGLIEALPVLIEKVPMIIAKIVETLVNKFPEIVYVASQLIGKLAMGLIGAIPKVIEAIGNVWQSMKRVLDNLPERVIEVGKNIVRGIGDGIISMKDWVKNKIKELASGMVDSIKDFLHISSPSKVFAEIGKFSAMGIGVGFEKEMKNVYKTLSDSVDFETQKLQTSLSSNIGQNIYAEIENTGDVVLDGRKVGQLITPYVSQTLRTAGA